MDEVSFGAGYKEVVDFGEAIGVWISADQAEGALTTKGIIHYGENGAHIVPANPNQSHCTHIVSLRLSGQRALLGAISPNLRQVRLVQNEKGIFLHFYYDRMPSLEEKELANLAHTEFVADFFMECSNVCFTTSIIPSSHPLPKSGYCLYLRSEPTQDKPQGRFHQAFFSLIKRVYRSLTPFT